MLWKISSPESSLSKNGRLELCHQMSRIGTIDLEFECYPHSVMDGFWFNLVGHSPPFCARIATIRRAQVPSVLPLPASDRRLHQFIPTRRVEIPTPMPSSELGLVCFVTLLSGPTMADTPPISHFFLPSTISIAGKLCAVPPMAPLHQRPSAPR